MSAPISIAQDEIGAALKYNQVLLFQSVANLATVLNSSGQNGLLVPCASNQLLSIPELSRPIKRLKVSFQSKLSFSIENAGALGGSYSVPGDMISFTTQNTDGLQYDGTGQTYDTYTQFSERYFSSQLREIRFSKTLGDIVLQYNFDMSQMIQTALVTPNTVNPVDVTLFIFPTVKILF